MTVDATVAPKSDTRAEADADQAAARATERCELEDRVGIISHLLQAHGGGIELMPSSDPEVVRVKFTGLCTACCLRPLTTANIINPVIGTMEGVRKVEVDGVRISEETMADLARLQ
ncbi:MAG: NifU family protein [Actinomycetota bacterium]|nr:NifU family protein [Actinomycetota bacterium]